MKLREFIQSATKKIVLENEVPQTLGFNPQPDYGRGTMGDLSKSYTPEKKSPEAARGDFLGLAKDIEAKFGDVFGEDLKAIYDGLKNVWSHIRPLKGKPAYSLGHSSQEGADEVLFTLGKEINEEISSFKNFLASQGFDKISNAIDIVSSYLGKLRNKVEEFENILTSGFEEPPVMGFKESKIRKIIKEEIDKIFNGGIGERIYSRIEENVPDKYREELLGRLRSIEDEEEAIEAFDEFLGNREIPFLPEEWDEGVFKSLSDHFSQISIDNQNALPENWEKQ